MLSQRKSWTRCLTYVILLTLSTILLRSENFMVCALDQSKPLWSDFAICELSAEEKENFLDEHNKFRGTVDPPAADMEYLFWNEELANLAQMWSDQCIWGHGFMEFGDQYQNPVPFTGKLGQNLAREWGQIRTPSDRVERWYLEHQYYTYSKFSSPMGASCSKEPCGHYTQLAWASTKYLGCAARWCDKEFGQPHPWIPGETIVTCNYGPKTGNIIGEYPYRKGTPCSKCASGSGFCYKDLCRQCDNFDSECDKSLTMAMCTSHRDLMAKKCPKMCNLCECPLKCQHGGTVNKQQCVCLCPSGWKGLDCSVKECRPGYYGENCEIRCEDRVGKETCIWRVRNGHDCREYYMEVDCAATCGYCDDGSKLTTTTTTPVTTTPTPNSTPRTLPTTAPTTRTTVENFPGPTPEVCVADLNSNCPFWAGFGECEENSDWMIPNCCISCKEHQAPAECKDKSATCPIWAYSGECDNNREWMQTNCRKSCNQCGECKDSDAKCPSWALLNQCHVGDRIAWMITNCRKSCGLCQAHDRYEECPAWGAMDECKKSQWTWMVNQCPRSCDVPFSEVSFCGDKDNGNYQSPITCSAYIACSRGTTSHVACPETTKFDTETRTCQPEETASCEKTCSAKIGPGQ